MSTPDLCRQSARFNPGHLFTPTQPVHSISIRLLMDEDSDVVEVTTYRIFPQDTGIMVVQKMDFR